MEPQLDILGYQLTGKLGIAVSTGNVVSFPLHGHTYFELLLYLPFQGEITVNGKSFPVDEPSILLLTPNDIHKTTAFTTSPYWKVAISPALLSRLDTLPDHAKILTGGEKISFLQSCFQQMHAERDNPSLLLSIIDVVMKLLCAKGLGIHTQNRIQQTIAQALGRIHSSFTENITLQQVASETGLSAPYFSELFHRETGLCYSEYLKTIRLQYAAQLLIQESLRVTDVCMQCGFGNFSHFLRSFKQMYGCTPKEYAKSHRKTPSDF